MKNIIAILCLAAFTASAQFVPIAVGSYPGDPSGEQIGHQMMVKLNYDLAYFENLATNQAAQIAALQAAGPQSNMVLSSSTVSLLNSNPFVFNGTSNYLGSFTNIFSLTCIAGTNALTNMMSADGGASWLPYAQTNPIAQVIQTNFWTNHWVYSTPYYVTNSTNSSIIYTLSQLGTNYTTNSLVFTNWISGPLQLAVLSSEVCTGSVVVTALADPSLQGRYYDFAGETLNLPQVASNTAAIAALTGMTINIQIYGPTTNTIYFTNGILKAVSSP
jgi:hypothetical protein